MYEIIFTTEADRLFRKLPKPIQLRINSVLERIKIRPFSYVKRLVDSVYYRVRVGDYRIILDIKKDKLIILVITMGLRKKIYKKFSLRKL